MGRGIDWWASLSESWYAVFPLKWCLVKDALVKAWHVINIRLSGSIVWLESQFIIYFWRPSRAWRSPCFIPKDSLSGSASAGLCDFLRDIEDRDYPRVAMSIMRKKQENNEQSRKERNKKCNRIKGPTE